MFYKRFILFFLFLLSIQLSYATHIDNSTHDSLYLESDGFCAGISVPFKIWNLTDYENRDEIEDDEDLNFTIMSGFDVEVFNGSSEIFPLIFNSEADSNGEFSVLFPIENDYRIVIYPNSNNFDTLEETFSVETCRFANSQTTTSSNSQNDINRKYYNQSFFFLDRSLKLTINNTDLNSSSNVTLKKLSEQEISNLNPPSNYFIGEVIDFTLSKENYTSMSMEISFIDMTNIIKVKKFNSPNFEDISYQIKNNKIIIPSLTSGIYLFMREEEIVLPEPTIKEEVKPVIEDTQINENANTEVNSNLENNNLNETQVSTNKTKSNSITGTIITIVLILFGLGAGGYGSYLLYIKYVKAKTEIDSDKDHNSKQNIIQSYSEIESRVSKYIKDNKSKYSKESLRIQLEKSKVPKEIIDKVYSKEYD